MTSELLQALVKYKRLVEWCEEELWEPCQAYHDSGHTLSISYFDNHLFRFLIREGLELSPRQFHVSQLRIDSSLKYHYIPYQAIETTLFDGCGHDGRLVIESYDRARNLLYAKKVFKFTLSLSKWRRVRGRPTLPRMLISD